MERWVVSAILITAGIYTITHGESIQRNNIKFQNRLWGPHFGKKNMVAAKPIGRAIGLIFTTFGLVILFGLAELDV
jgi:hypothetical protein